MTNPKTVLAAQGKLKENKGNIPLTWLYLHAKPQVWRICQCAMAIEAGLLESAPRPPIIHASQEPGGGENHHFSGIDSHAVVAC